MKREVIKRKSTKAKVKTILEDEIGTNIFMILEPVKMSLWNYLFRRKKLMETIETNYIILSNEKTSLVEKVWEIVK